MISLPKAPCHAHAPCCSRFALPHHGNHEAHGAHAASDGMHHG